MKKLNFLIGKKSKDNTIISRLNYTSKDTNISLSDLFLDKDYKIENFKSINIQTEKNSIVLNKNKKKVKGKKVEKQKLVINKNAGQQR